MRFRQSPVLGLIVLSTISGKALAASLEVHYAPVENLERIDVGLLQAARSKIDMAAYSLTDWPVIDALIEAHRRGVVIRVVLDPSQQHALDRLREISSDVRMKPSGPYMHLKSYSLDRSLLRSGSANLTASGLKQQDNDIVVARDSEAAKAFEGRFEQIWAEAKPIRAVNPIAASPTGGPTSMTPERANGCTIKGNVSRKGERIYHMPGDRSYARIRMNKGVGKRWFCSEGQAVEAGWRPAEFR